MIYCFTGVDDDGEIVVHSPLELLFEDGDLPRHGIGVVICVEPDLSDGDLSMSVDELKNSVELLLWILS